MVMIHQIVKEQADAGKPAHCGDYDHCQTVE
jgi:hypothetical protein